MRCANDWTVGLPFSMKLVAILEGNRQGDDHLQAVKFVVAGMVTVSFDLGWISTRELWCLDQYHACLGPFNALDLRLH